MYDIDNDGFPGIIINQSGLEQIGYNEFDRYDFSLVYKPTSVVSADYDYNINLPTEYKLYQNYPNPFNPTTTIKFSIPAVIASADGIDAKQSHNTTLKVYDILGREITVLVNEYLSPGNYEVEFNAEYLSSGVYYYRLTNGTFSQTRKMNLLK